jgi:hypothetical protein
MLDKKYFFQTSIFSFFFLLLSFLVFLLPQFNNPVWCLIVILALIISLIKLEWGLYIALGELFFGSMGYLFGLNLGGFFLSIRLGLFLVIMAVWLVKALLELIKAKKLTKYFTLRHSPLAKWYLLLGVVLIWGVVWGYLRQNAFNNLFFDFNAWLFFLYILPFYDVLNKEKISQVLGILAGSIAVLSLLTFFSFLVFTQNWANIAPSFYKWIRDLRLGEITFAGGNLWRVFLQSQIYAAIGAVLFFWLWLKKYDYQLRINNYEFVLFFVSGLTTIISLSRSYWLGCLGAWGILFLWLLIKDKIGIKKVLSLGLVLITAVVIQVLLVWGIAGVGSGQLLTKRITEITDAAGASRWNQLKPLGLAITSYPIIGSGFGTTVTYQSQDPRILKNSPNGWYTTYAFEWGYLDMLLKIGLFGLVIYLILIGKIIKGMGNGEWGMGMILGLVVILLASIFSPYMNHPLGIGYLLLLSSLSKS